MHAAGFALPAVASAPGCCSCSARGRGEAVVARALRVPMSSPSSSAAAAVGGPFDLLLLRCASAAAATSSLSRPRVPARRRLRPLSHQPRASTENSNSGDGDGDGDRDADGASSSSSSSSPPPSGEEKLVVDIDVEVEGKKKKQTKKATPLGDLIALIRPFKKREAGGPPPPTLSRRLWAIKGSLRAVVEHAWQKTLTLPGFSHVAAALRAVDAFTRPARELVRDHWMDVNERLSVFIIEEEKQCWAWESRSKAQGLVWKKFCNGFAWFVLSFPYLVLCPSHVFFSCVIPLVVGFSAFDHPIWNGVTLAWAVVMVAGKLRRGLLSGLVGLPPGFSGI